MGVLIGLVVFGLIVVVRHDTMRRWMTRGGKVEWLALAMVAPLYLVLLVSTASKSIETWADDPFQAAFTLAILGSAFLFAWWVMATMMRAFTAIAPNDPPARPKTPPPDGSPD